MYPADDQYNNPVQGKPNVDGTAKIHLVLGIYVQARVLSTQCAQE
jgi:hypothetical protein